MELCARGGGGVGVVGCVLKGVRGGAGAKVGKLRLGHCKSYMNAGT